MYDKMDYATLMRNNMNKIVKMKPDIHWEKWADPYEVDMVNNPPEQENNEDEGWQESSQEIQITGKYIFTPMGYVAVSDAMTLTKRFNFWVGHTNHELTRVNVQLLENVDGVETLDIWTKYRFRVGIGRLFQDGKVMYQMKQVFRNFWTKQNETDSVTTQ